MWRRVGAQISHVVPDRMSEITGEGVDQDLVLIKFEDDVRKPPVSFALDVFAVGRGLTGRWIGLESPLDDVGNLDGRC